MTISPLFGGKLETESASKTRKLNHPAILDAIKTPKTTRELADIFGVTQAAVYVQLKALKSLGKARCFGTRGQTITWQSAGATTGIAHGSENTAGEAVAKKPRQPEHPTSLSITVTNTGCVTIRRSDLTIRLTVAETVWLSRILQRVTCKSELSDRSLPWADLKP